MINQPFAGYLKTMWNYYQLFTRIFFPGLKKTFPWIFRMWSEQSELDFCLKREDNVYKSSMDLAWITFTHVLVGLDVNLWGRGWAMHLL